MVNLNNVYNYYSSTILPPKGNQKSNSSHKKDDLKTLYQNIVKQNKDSPLYKFTFSDQIQAYAIGIKEAAMALEAESDSLSGDGNKGFAEMKAVSSNEKVAYARLREDASEELPEDLTIQVNSLAKGQTNVGYYLPSGELSIPPGSYSFGIAVNDNEYTFHMNIEEDDMFAAIRKAGKKLGHFHVGENNRRLPGKGGLDWYHIGEALREIGYDGNVVMEPFVQQGGGVGNDIKIWRDLSHGADGKQLDDDASNSVAYLRYCFSGPYSNYTN